MRHVPAAVRREPFVPRTASVSVRGFTDVVVITAASVKYYCPWE
ncbi:hypothetical protein ACFWPK_02065 [Nocardia sp. NPDC058519]